MSISFFVRDAPLRPSTDAPKNTSKASRMAWSTRTSTMLRRDRAPYCLNRLISMVVTKAATSIARNKLDLQIIDAGFRQIENAQNSLVVQAVVSSQKQHALFRGPAAQDVSHARGQLRCSDLLITQYHATISRKPLPGRGLDDAASRSGNDQDQPRFLRLRGCGVGRFRDINVIALHEKRDHDHEDDQQHEHYVDQRRNVNLGLQIGSGIPSVELHNLLSSRACAAPL